MKTVFIILLILLSQGCKKRNQPTAVPVAEVKTKVMTTNGISMLESAPQSTTAEVATEKLQYKKVDATTIDKSDVLDWMNSQLGEKTIIVAITDDLKCDSQKAIERYYLQGLNREATKVELTSQLTKLKSSDLKAIRHNILNSPEFLNAFITPQIFIDRSFQLLLSHLPRNEEKKFYLKELNSGKTREQVTAAIAKGDEFIKSPDCQDLDFSWVSPVETFQPLKTIVDRKNNLAYWRKDDGRSFYGTVFTFDKNYIYLRSETFPFFEQFDGSNPVASWDVRLDKFRLFSGEMSSAPKKPGRLMSLRKIDLTSKIPQPYYAFACYSFKSYLTGTCRPLQSNAQDSRVSMEKVVDFSTVFDGEDNNPKLKVDDEFKKFDEVIVWNVESNEGKIRERFYFGKKNNKYYGLIRWDSARYTPALLGYKILHRTVGIKQMTDPDFSMEELKVRGSLEK
jgi:hypothetical protein